jgi:selenocysteine lyase/cysteine desulfurase
LEANKHKNMPTTSFNYLQENLGYFDHACQSLRPEKVLQAEFKYYTTSNACAGRGNHPLTEYVDKKIEETREKILEFVGKNKNSYTVVFCPNTTYGINLILSNLNWSKFDSVATTQKEHNSVLLPSISYSKKFDKKLTFLEQNEDFSFDPNQLLSLKHSVCLFNTTSNIDGHKIKDIEVIVKTLKIENNIVLLDATQSLAHSNIDWTNIDFDCLFCSGHKMYAPSIGFMVIKKKLIKSLDQYWVGGGTIQEASTQDYKLIEYDSEIQSRLEFGLQDYAAIFGLNQAIDWLKNYNISYEYPKLTYQPKESGIFLDTKNDQRQIYINNLANFLFKHLKTIEKAGRIKIINKTASSIVSFYSYKVDSYGITRALSAKGLVARSGFMCAHSYIKEGLEAPALVRISLGLHNTPKELIKLLETIAEITS